MLLERLLEDDERRAAMGRAAAAEVDRRASTRVVSEIYRSLLVDQVGQEADPEPAGRRARRTRTGSPRRLRVADVYRHFNRAGSIPSIYTARAEWLAGHEDVTAVCAASTRAETDAPLRFETVEPVGHGRGRFVYALECASFALRAQRLLHRARSRFDVVHVEGYACLRADLVSVHAVRALELEHYFSEIEPDARLRRRLAPVLRPQNGTVLAIERSLFRPPPPLCLALSSAIARDLERHHGVASRPDRDPPVRSRPLPLPPRPRRSQAGARGARRRPGAARAPVRRRRLRAQGARPGDRRSSRRQRAPAELWVAGRGAPDRYRGLAASAGVLDRVRFLGRLPHDQLAAYYAAADALVLPSRQDAWGHPVLEAMASGAVVLVSEFAGAHEVVVPGENGFVLERAGSPEEIAALIDGPLARADDRARIGAAAVATTRPFEHEALNRRFRAAHHRAYERRLALTGS